MNRMTSVRFIVLASAAALLAVFGLSAVAYLIVVKLDRQAEDIRKLTDLMLVESPADGGHRRLDVRLFAIRSQLAQADAPVIVIGDSITEGALLPSSICGHTVVNAGVGGMNAAGYLPFAKQFLTKEAALIIVALGTNDSTIISPEWSVVEPRYSDLLDLLAQHTHNLVIAGIPPFDMTGALAKDYFKPALGDGNDAAIRRIAANRKLSFVDLRNDISGMGLTVDGIHLNAAGYTRWRDDILSHVRSSIGCSEAKAR
jgi:lysophospholipase L1-like esterase